MKKLALLFVLCFVAFNLFSQVQPVLFNISDLSVDEITNCEKFKKMKGQERWREFQKIKHIFPHCELSIDSISQYITYNEETVNMIMTKEQLIELIGEPDFRGIDYELGVRQYDCEVTFILNENNEVLNFAYSSCGRYMKN